MLQNTDPLPTGLASEGRVNHTKGAIVNFASRRGLHGTQVEVPYTATKHAMIGLSRSAAAGYASKGIRINTREFMVSLSQAGRHTDLTPICFSQLPRDSLVSIVRFWNESFPSL